ncbi:hypothetical protein A8M77_31600 [Variovorax sp. JS1663]|nr:hypothetical protein A8M77_31600 [Variovorax sp. JS1663]
MRCRRQRLRVFENRAEGQEGPAGRGDLAHHDGGSGQAAPLAGDELHPRADVASVDQRSGRFEILGVREDVRK